ncbi:DUF3592 domain-containing protein [Hymenobacter bucti]|uniref:DUF3592 domain-containing protein n=1 Tax=Hymenobacter bucti TaxID=1844114 RepID=A0ABW4QWD1_9BACT
MAKSKQVRKASFDIQAWLGIIILLLLSAYFLRACTRWRQEAAALSQGVFTTKAVVIDKKNYVGNSPVSYQFTYSYQFALQGKNYEGNSHNPALHIGDSILVEYSPKNPTYNRVHN